MKKSAEKASGKRNSSATLKAASSNPSASGKAGAKASVGKVEAAKPAQSKVEKAKADGKSAAPKKKDSSARESSARDVSAAESSSKLVAKKDKDGGRPSSPKLGSTKAAPSRSDLRAEAPSSPAVVPPPRKLRDDEVDEATGLSAKDVAHLRELLLQERLGVLGRLENHVGEVTSDDSILTDEIDIASRHQDQAFLLRLADKERKLLKEIDRALTKIEDGSYGVCEGTGEPIGLRRLEARPWARYSIAYKEQLEREEGGRKRM
jgi:DnaK suppressor protein